MKKVAIGCVVLASLAVFFRSAFLPGWASQTTDFPNYYTAAVLTRQRLPLRLFYDWTWFQREMDLAGIEAQLGGYIPQTPLAMFPLLPLSGMRPQTAKRWWLALNLLFLAGTIGILARLTGFLWSSLWLLVFAGYTSLQANFLLGQYYVLVLFLLTLCIYSLQRTRDSIAGVLAGVVFGLKLYTGPFLLYFLAKRQWRAALAMLLTMAGCGLVAIAIFGWADVRYFAMQVLPRALDGEIVNPFHPASGTFSTLLHRMLMTEPELNPHPLLAAPALFFFLRALLPLSILMVPVVAAASAPKSVERRELAWFLIALLLATPNTASYAFVILVLPVALLLGETAPQRRWWILVPFILAGTPFIQTWSWAFPKLWLLLILFVEAGRGSWKTIQPRYALATSVVVVLVSLASAWFQFRSYRQEPGRNLPLAVSETDAIYSGSPLVSRAAIWYQAMAPGHYVLRRSGDGKNQSFFFGADAFNPAAPNSGVPVYFEMVRAGVSRIASFDPSLGRPNALPIAVPDPREPAVSHDGARLAIVSRDSLYLFDGNTARRLATPVPVKDPSFTRDDRGIIFSSDSGNGSRIYVFDLAARQSRVLLSVRGHLARPSLSTDSKRLLFASDETGPWQVSIANLNNADSGNSHTKMITHGRCNNFSPAWAFTPGEIVFSSDCGRGLGLPVLYRLKLSPADVE